MHFCCAALNCFIVYIPDMTALKMVAGRGNTLTLFKLHNHMQMLCVGKHYITLLQKFAVQIDACIILVQHQTAQCMGVNSTDLNKCYLFPLLLLCGWIGQLPLKREVWGIEKNIHSYSPLCCSCPIPALRLKTEWSHDSWLFSLILVGGCTEHPCLHCPRCPVCPCTFQER